MQLLEKTIFLMSILIRHYPLFRMSRRLTAAGSDAT